jgi:hypothetical protein
MVISALSLAWVCGCSSAPQRAMLVQVRDAQGRPTQGVNVRVVTQNPTHPFRVGDYFESPTPLGPSGQTDAGGAVRLSAAEGKPMNLVFVVPGRGARSWSFDDHPLALGELNWRPISDNPANPGPEDLWARVGRIDP